MTQFVNRRATMGLARGGAGFWILAGLDRWRSQFDFDAPRLTVCQQLERLEYAAEEAIRQCGDRASEVELGFALSECRALLAMGSLEGEGAEGARVQQRLERIRRVVTYHEGWPARFNRRYWWAACSVGLLVLTGCWVQCVLAP